MVGKNEFDLTAKNNGMNALQYIAHLKDVYKNNKGLGKLIGVNALFEKTTEPAEEVVIPISLTSDKNGIKEYHQRKRKTDYGKHQGSQKLSEEMPSRAKVDTRKEVKQTYKPKQLLAVGMLDRYGGVEIDASERQIGDGTEEFEEDWRHFIKKPFVNRPIVIIKRTIYDANITSGIPTEPEIEEYSSPYTSELIEANENW